MIKVLGAVIIISACGFFGFSLAAGYRREEKALQQMISALDFIQCELQFRMTPLPELCRMAGNQNNGIVGRTFLILSEYLETGLNPDARNCMELTLKQMTELPQLAKNGFSYFGRSLGRFDLDGQVSGIESVRSYCRQELEKLHVNREERLRSYQTLGLCAGAAIAIIFV